MIIYVQPEYNHYVNIRGEIHKYVMNSQFDIPEERKKTDRNIDVNLHECLMYECKFIFSGCDRNYKKPIIKSDKRKCVEYKHKNSI
jgi:hypothetical protein